MRAALMEMLAVFCLINNSAHRLLAIPTARGVLFLRQKRSVVFGMSHFKQVYKESRRFQTLTSWLKLDEYEEQQLST